MGPRLLCFAGGAALAAYFVLLGLLATPYFGSGAFVWSNVFACFLLALAFGHGLGDLIVALAHERLKRVAPAVAVLGGGLAWLSAYALPTVCRLVLGRDAEWTFAPAVAIAAASLVPGAVIAAVVPCELRARLDGCENARAGARVTLRLISLMTCGGIAGVLLCGKPLLRADEVAVWAYAYGTGALLVLLGAAFLRLPGKLAAAALLGGLALLCAIRPSEVQSQSYAVALQTAWKEASGAGLYYRWTSSGELDEDAIARAARAEGAEKPGLILTLEFLERMGQGRVDGPGLERCVDLFLSSQSRPFILPFFQQIEEVRSDGKGMLYIDVKATPGKIGREFEIPGANPGETVKFWFKSDFTIRLEHRGRRWRLDFGPRTREAAGLFEFNDTLLTPIRVLNVALWVDASILALTVDDLPDQVVLKAEAQGDIGDIRSVEIYAAPKEKARR